MRITTSLAVLSLVLGATAAYARTLPLMGGPGGGPSTLRCPAGEHLVGLKVRSGLWIDRVTIECARLERSGATIRHVDLRLHGSAGGGGGGESPTKTCFGGRAIGSLGVHEYSSKTRMVREMTFGCVTDTAAGGGTLTVGSSAGTFPNMQSCGRGEAAVGLQTRSGLYLDAVGLICERMQIRATTPAPGPGPGPVAGSSASSKILAYARANVGKCVDNALNVRGQRCPSLPIGQVGDGECTDLVNGAIVSAGFARVSNYVWGQKVGDQNTGNKGAFQPGDIIQLFNVKLVGANGWWETGSQHTAIIESNAGGVLTVLEQNTNVNGENRRFVTRGTLNLTWRLERGSYVVYRK